jgi:hypothetical protein
MFWLVCAFYVARMTPTPRIIWAYSYQLVPPQHLARLGDVRALLVRERASALGRSATWEGRLVADERIAHILVLSDSPDLDREANRRLEHALHSMGTGFALTVPMAVPAEPPAVVPPKD